MAHRNAAALMHHILMRELAKRNQITSAALAGHPSAPLLSTDEAGNAQMT